MREGPPASMECPDDLLVSSRYNRRVKFLRLNRTAARNALSTPLLRRLAAQLAAWDEDDEARCVVIAGDNRAFAAGADLGELVDRPAEASFDDPRSTAWRAIRNMRKPIVACVEGVALGGGFELALACDIVVAGENATFAFPEIGLGLLPGGGGTQFMTRIAGKHFTALHILTGEKLSAVRAVEFGLISELVPAGQAEERGFALAERIADASPTAVRLAKDMIKRAYESPLSDACEFERRSFAIALGTGAAQASIKAFLEKRDERGRAR